MRRRAKFSTAPARRLVRHSRPIVRPG